MKGFRFYGLTIDAGVEIPLAVSGNLVACMEASGAVQVGLDDEAAFPMERGIRVRVPDGQEFSNLRVKNSGGAPITVTLAVGYGELHDGRLTMTGGTLDSLTSVGTVGTLIASRAPLIKAHGDFSLAAGAKINILAADDNVCGLWLANLGTTTIRVGNVDIGPNDGLPLAGGQTLYLATRGEVYVFNPGAGAVTVARATMRWE